MSLLLLFRARSAQAVVSATSSATALSTPAGVQTYVGAVASADTSTAASTVAGAATTTGAVANAASATSATAPAGAQTYAGAVAPASTATTASAPSGVQTLIGAVAGAVSATAASTPAGVQTHVGSASSVGVEALLSAPSATQIYLGQVAAAVSSTSASSPAGTQTSWRLSAQHAAWLEALARLHGLIDPLRVTAAGRSDGAVTQTFTESAGTTTVTTVIAPSGVAEASALTATQAGWLEALVRAHGLIAPLQVSATQRSDGALVQTVAESDGTVTLTRAA